MNVNIKKSSKYDMTKLEPDTTEFITVKNFFEVTKNPTVYGNYSSDKNFQIWKVINKNSVNNQKRNNIMLFHGTTRSATENILNIGK